VTDKNIKSVPGDNPWNIGREPENWWGLIKESHGHVGPWNVVGYRMGRAILREMEAHWGDHSLVIICHIPLDTPYSCLVDGVAVGTGNSQGRLDLRIGEVAALEFLHVSAVEKNGEKRIIFKPRLGYLQKIENRPVSELENLARECAEMPEADIFEIIN
jgi:formylmethanofuran dehydrogenase subunit E